MCLELVVCVCCLRGTKRDMKSWKMIQTNMLNHVFHVLQLFENVLKQKLEMFRNVSRKESGASRGPHSSHGGGRGGTQGVNETSSY